MKNCKQPLIFIKNTNKDGGVIMPRLEMNGPYDFHEKSIENEITRISAGNYALGRINKEEKFIVEYVGRSDNDVKERLKQHIGERYTKFKYSYASSSKEAFDKECKNYHDFGGSSTLNNKIHPDRPENTNWKCQFCDNFDD